MKAAHRRAVASAPPAPHQCARIADTARRNRCTSTAPASRPAIHTQRYGPLQTTLQCAATPGDTASAETQTARSPPATSSVDAGSCPALPAADPPHRSPREHADRPACRGRSAGTRPSPCGSPRAVRCSGGIASSCCRACSATCHGVCSTACFGLTAATITAGKISAAARACRALRDGMKKAKPRSVLPRSQHRSPAERR